MSNDVLVEIPTKNRDAILAQTFAGFINQTFQDFDVLVINDGEEEVGRCKMTKLMLEILRNRRNVEVIEGSHISQAHNHNIPLFDPKYRQYQIIVRWDDDIIPNRRNLEYMVDAIRTLKADAIGGLWFEHEWISDEIHDRATITWDMRKRVETDGLVAVVNNNIQQRMYHPTDDLYEVQHIYSACAYRAQDMRDVGGWPEVYSPGVAHGEETDGCYRLRLSGCCLLIDPRITGQHLKSPGGIRQDKAVNEKQYADRIKWESRFPKLDEISFSPTVAVWCEHADGIGGAQRLFYETIHVLQQEYSPDFVYPIFSGAHYSPE
jgi:GT2 family glycosyltransferase